MKMVKMILAAALITALVMSLFGCAKKEEESAQVVGGWTIPDEGPSVELTDDEQAIFDAAAEAAGGDLAYAGLLGTQVVAGINYAFLAKGASGWTVLTAYHNFDGSTELLSAKEIDIANPAVVESSGADDAEIVGGWEIAASGKAAMLPEDAQAAFDTAMADSGVAAAPVALLGTQVVSGTNYLVLCTGTPEGSDKAVLYLAKIYQDLDGNVELSELQVFDLTSYIEY